VEFLWVKSGGCGGCGLAAAAQPLSQDRTGGPISRKAPVSNLYSMSNFNIRSRIAGLGM
jgi:hypothetical protein